MPDEVNQRGSPLSSLLKSSETSLKYEGSKYIFKINWSNIKDDKKEGVYCLK